MPLFNTSQQVYLVVEVWLGNTMVSVGYIINNKLPPHTAHLESGVKIPKCVFFVLFFADYKTFCIQGERNRTTRQAKPECASRQTFKVTRKDSWFCLSLILKSSNGWWSSPSTSGARPLCGKHCHLSGCSRQRMFLELKIHRHSWKRHYQVPLTSARCCLWLTLSILMRLNWAARVLQFQTMCLCRPAIDTLHNVLMAGENDSVVPSVIHHFLQFVNYVMLIVGVSTCGHGAHYFHIWKVKPLLHQNKSIPGSVPSSLYLQA